MNKGSKIKMNIGTSSFVVIFVIVSLATFAVLSLVSANANKKSSEQAIHQIDEYYRMSNLAQTQLESTDTLLKENYAKVNNQNDYFNLVYNQLKINDHYYTFMIEGDIQNLVVTIEIKYPNSGDTFYDIISWNKQAKEEWNPKNNTNLLKTEGIYGDTRIININYTNRSI